MRLLLADLSSSQTPSVGSVLDDEALAGLYAAPTLADSWVRSNFVASIDGAITGSDGRSGSVNSDADQVVFELLRALSDVVIVGAGTLRSEGYGPLSVASRWRARRLRDGLAETLPLVAVSNQGHLPPILTGAPPGTVLLATHASAAGLAQARDELGSEHVLVCGDDAVDEGRLVTQLANRGLTRMLTEGGPHLLGSMLAAGVVDEVCLSITPVVVVGDVPRMTAGTSLEAAYLPRVLVEEGGTVMGRWTRCTLQSDL